jgi:hypothetical protein
MSALLALAGAVHLFPGRALPTIRSTRPDAAAALTTGRRASELPALLGNLFTVCAPAHRFVARRAVACALGQAGAAEPDEAQQLRVATLREQIMRISASWPLHLPGVKARPDPMLSLRGCPLWRNDWPLADQLSALPAWLEHHWLGMVPEQWLRHHLDEPTEWVMGWCERATSDVAGLLQAQLPAAVRLVTPTRPLDVLDDAATHLPALARDMADIDGFCMQPSWQGRVPDTGPWSRRADGGRLPTHNAWMRLVSRITDVLHLAGPDGADRLDHGALALRPNEGVAWTEMARGLLVHWVRLDPAGGADGAERRVAACRVLAPTEWNFHPHGVLAQSLAALWGPSARFDARRLAMAFDPCVEFEVHDA